VSDTDAAPSQQGYRLITSLLDEQRFPARLLASTSCERREIETTPDEVEVHQWAHPRPRAEPTSARGGPGGLRAAAGAAGHPHLHALCRRPGRQRPRPPQLQRCPARPPPRHPPRPALPTCDGPPLCADRVRDLLADELPPRRPRHHPRAVEPTMSPYPLKPPCPARPKAAPTQVPPSIRVLWR
jgi:hypothetical protein